MRGVTQRLYATSASVACATLLFASTPARIAAQVDNVDAPVEAQLDFAEQFAPFRTPPAPIEPAPGSVDLSTFDPPIEQEQVISKLGSGIASFYGRRFHGRRTANGERFNMNAMTAAHKTLPFGSMVKVTNPRNGRSVTVRINDRGPFIRGRVIDLSRAAASRIGMISRGHARVNLELVAR